MGKGKRNVFSQTGGAHPAMSGFDLSHEVKLTADMGLLYPVMCEMMMPGDIFHTGVQSILRCMPLVAPLMHEINMFFYDFFVPCRLMWDGFEDYITGGRDGDDISVLPRWEPTVPTGNAKGTLWDYFGFPVTIPRRMASLSRATSS